MEGHHMDTIAFSTWMAKIQELLLAFLSEPSDESEAALLSIMTQYREALKEEYAG